MTFGGSQNVFRILEQAKRSGKTFSVIVIDCEPDLKGRNLEKKLSGKEAIWSSFVYLT